MISSHGRLTHFRMSKIIKKYFLINFSNNVKTQFFHPKSSQIPQHSQSISFSFSKQQHSQSMSSISFSSHHLLKTNFPKPIPSSLSVLNLNSNSNSIKQLSSSSLSHSTHSSNGFISKPISATAKNNENASNNSFETNSSIPFEQEPNVESKKSRIEKDPSVKNPSSVKNASSVKNLSVKNLEPNLEPNLVTKVNLNPEPKTEPETKVILNSEPKTKSETKKRATKKTPKPKLAKILIQNILNPNIPNNDLEKMFDSNKTILNESVVYGTPPPEKEWSKIEKFLVFSDLHLARKTAHTCEEVLRLVHAEALSRNAGILFLGDFWNSRGSIPVEILNLSISIFQKWKVLSLFLTGNHDQLSLNGEEHALLVLESSNPKVFVISKPTIFLNALFIPYRFDHSIVEKVVKESQNKVKAIFCHVDIPGAIVNEDYQENFFISPHIFPPGLPVFSGHYHMPQKIKNSNSNSNSNSNLNLNFEYVGSPYQVTASEANQQKRFLVLDKDWNKIEEIPVDVGSKYFTFLSKNCDSNTILAPSNSNFPENLSFPSKETFPNLRSGDRVRWQLPDGISLLDAKSKVEWAKEMGVQIEIIFPLMEFQPRILFKENLNIFQIFQEYARNTKMKFSTFRQSIKILKNLNFSETLNSNSAHITFDSVELEGYGVFLHRQTYFLKNKGLRIISGRNESSKTFESNGTGKTTLISSILWAITGCTDPRPEASRGLTSSEVRNPNATSARVYLQGELNGERFSIERAVGKKSSLKFLIGDKDFTCQEIKLTQNNIDDKLNSNILRRCIFHGQHSTEALLLANDKDFKEELSQVVKLEAWTEAKNVSKENLKILKANLDQTLGAITELDKQQNQLKSKIFETKKKKDDWEIMRGENLKKVKKNLDENSKILEKNFFSFLEKMKNLENEAKQNQSFLNFFEKKMIFDFKNEENDEKEIVLRNEEKECGEKKMNLFQSIVSLNEKFKMKEMELNKKRRKKYEILSKNRNEIVCENCFQVIDWKIAEEKISILGNEIWELEQQQKNANQEIIEIRNQMNEMESKLEKIKSQKNEILNSNSTIKFSNQEKIQSIRNSLLIQFQTIENAKTNAENLFSKFCSLPELKKNWFSSSPEPENLFSNQNLPSSATVYQNNSISEPEFDFENFFSAVQNLAHFAAREVKKNADVVSEKLRDLEKCAAAVSKWEASENPHLREVKILEKMFFETEGEAKTKSSECGDLEKKVEILKQVESAFGYQGIQSYILEGALQELENRTNENLKIFCDQSCRLKLNPIKSASVSKSTVERIDKCVLVKLNDGDEVTRTVKQLSGGERRRMAISMALAFSDFASQRSGLNCDLMILDEMVQHLDLEGKSRLASLLKRMPQTSVLVVSQSHSDLTDEIERVDWVIKDGDVANVYTAEEMAQSLTSL